MKQVFLSAWALLTGILLLMLGNGMQSTLVGIRAEIEGFSTLGTSVMMSAYFVGFLFASRAAPELIRRVGHVRVFAALGSMISAALILFPSVTEPWAWVFLRMAIGFCFCGVYVTAESWLNNSATNETRGQALSLYMIVQMLGIVAAQGIVALGDPSGFILFIVPSVLVSLAFAPILLSVNPTPAFDTTKRMSLMQLYRTSPLGIVGMFLMGGVYAGMFGMSAVYASRAGLTVPQISAFVAALYVGGMVLQFPVGWLSDRMDRRRLLMISAFLAAAASLVGLLAGGYFPLILLAGLLYGGLANPLYALLIAYTNDYLDHDDMPAASGGMLFVNGIGAILGPLAIGPALDLAGPSAYWGGLGTLMLAMAGYAIWRTYRRPETPSGDETYSYAPVLPSSSPVAVEAAQELYAEAVEDGSDTVAPTNDGTG